MKLSGKSRRCRFLSNFNKKVEESKEKLAAAGLIDKTVTIIEGGKKEMAVVTSKQYGRGSQIIYEYLGMKAPEIVQKKIDVATEASGDSVSMEVLSEYIRDYVFRSSYKGMDDLTGNSIWNSIPDIKEGRLIEISFNLFYFSDNIPLISSLTLLWNSCWLGR